MPEPSAKSAAERRLERVHSDDDDPVTAEDRHETQVNLERELATLLAHHPAISLEPDEVLSAVNYSLDELRVAAAEFYPDRFGGGEAGA